MVLAPVDARLGEGEEEEGEGTDGGVQQAREPELPDAAGAEPVVQPASDPLGLDEDIDPAADKRLIDAARPLAPVLAGHAIDEALHRSGSQLDLGL